ncbi:hypothetical protein Pla123a_40140 [Posidoniimonas polymericola]|uniref:Uncharacterized protein n=1 Tax=Posidoniimonas polymericola TaxID=2528002 RepID=A0A5C5YEI1_9BACT|nr:hypothetical protein [Posidoniimonas polymericola]TWT72715.1 hypothetical protein Pla123a_40140 [Posidoniimonas polymericola]
MLRLPPPYVRPALRARVLRVLGTTLGALCAVAVALVGPAASQPPIAPPVDESITDSAQPFTAEKAVATVSAPELPPAPDSLQLPVESHPWGRFDVGAWRTLRTVTETFDESGRFLTRSETLHTDKLSEITDESYTLETTSVVEVGGKRLRGATQVTRRSLLTDHTSQSPIAVEHPAVDISLGGKTIPCQQWELTYGEGPQRRIETLFYAPEFPPYLMRREVAAPDGSSASDLTGEVTSVLAVDVPILLEGGMVAGYRQQVRATAGANQIERTELLCGLAPGGLVQASSTERDASGRRVRWVVTELEDFGDAGDAPETERRWRLFRRQGR